MTSRGKDWDKFQKEVLNHIETYTVPQYGDKGEDLADEYSTQDCLNQVKKYVTRYGKNAREGQEKLDLLKMAHYIQMGFEALEKPVAVV